MAQAAVILRRAHEKERRRRELENIIDHSVTVNHNSDTSLSGAGRNSSPETFYQNKKIETGCSLNQSPEKEVWVGHVCALFFSFSNIIHIFEHTKVAQSNGFLHISVFIFVWFFIVDTLQIVVI